MSLHGFTHNNNKTRINNSNNIKHNLLEAAFWMQNRTKISVTSLQTILKWQTRYIYY